MKQTAVGFLKKHIENDAIALYDGFITFTEFMDKLDAYYSKAKKMEKQQIIEANEENMMSFTDGEQYYNETFNKGQ